MADEMLNGFTGFSNKASGNFQYTRDAREQAEPLEFDPADVASLGELDKRWAWCEVSLGAVQHNALEARRFMAPGCQLMAVVKADAYGHGAIECAKAAIRGGATWLGVATVDEAVQLRDAGFNEPILVLAEPPMATIPILLSRKIVPAVYSTEFALLYGETADQHNMVAPYHLALNTGMNRIGVRAEDAMEFLSQVNFHRGLELTGVMTHFATADMPDSLEVQMQLRRFNEALAAIRTAGIDPGIVHAANSAAIFRYPQAHFDMVRLGISLYGYHPCPETIGIAQLQPALRVKARITQVKTVPVSEGVSYGLHYRSPGSVKICTIPVGYADGFDRALSGNTDVLVGGYRCHQVGNICMDQSMFEVDLRDHGAARRFIDPQVGDEVLLVGTMGEESITIDELANKLQTIPHEVTIGFSHRMKRIYV